MAEDKVINFFKYQFGAIVISIYYLIFDYVALRNANIEKFEFVIFIFVPGLLIPFAFISAFLRNKFKKRVFDYLTYGFIDCMVAVIGIVLITTSFIVVYEMTNHMISFPQTGGLFVVATLMVVSVVSRFKISLKIGGIMFIASTIILIIIGILGQYEKLPFVAGGLLFATILGMVLTLYAARTKIYSFKKKRRK